MDWQMGGNSFSVYWSDATTGNILDTNNNNEKKRKTYWPVARQKHTSMQTGST